MYIQFFAKVENKTGEKNGIYIGKKQIINPVLV